jgi:hypothetical protein
MRADCHLHELVLDGRVPMLGKGLPYVAEGDRV